MSLEAKPGFDWRRVAWGKPDSPVSEFCSYCFARIPDNEMPLMLWKPDGHAAQFCDACMEKWFGLELKHSEPPIAAPIAHGLAGTLRGTDEGIEAVCLCGWRSGPRFSSAVATALFIIHLEKRDSKKEGAALPGPRRPK